MISGEYNSKIKVCGLKRLEDIQMVNRYKPDYCGFIINFPKSHRSLDEEQVRNLVGHLDREHVIPVGVFVDSSEELVIRLLEDGVIDIAQLHGNESEEYIKKIRTVTNKPVIKAYKVKNKEDIAFAVRSSADYILLDQGQGDGKCFDWSILDDGESSYYSELKDRKWFLAGGLNEDNIEDAIRRFRPYCLDLSSALETDGIKDEEKIKNIIEKVRRVEL